MKLNPRLRRRRILIVHPEVDVILRLRRVILEDTTSSRYELMAAANAKGGMRLFAARHPDLILLHVEQENLGPTLKWISHVRAAQADRHVGIITLGAAGVACLEAGADDFLPSLDHPAELRARLRAALRLKSIHDELRTANHRLRILSLTDELTGLANMRGFGPKYNEMMRRCRAGELSFGVLMLDLDHFKSVNDTTNHLFGSFVISEIGRLFRKNSHWFSPLDLAARYGGDEFIVMLVGSPRDVEAKAERIREMIAAHAFEREGARVRVTASIGVAWVPPRYQDAAEEVIKIADMMLYHSKASGRNRVCMTRLLAEHPPAVRLAMTPAERSHADAINQLMKKRIAV